MEEPTPDQIRLEFLLYRKSCHETLGQFLANYHKRWLEANRFGIEGMEAIIHLIPLLPSEWQDWAITLIPTYIDRTLLGSFYGDLRGFIATLSHRYFNHGAPPPVPFPVPQNHNPEENDNNDPDDDPTLQAHVGNQGEPVQNIVDGEVDNGAAREQGVTSNGDMIVMGEGAVRSDAAMERRAGEVLENGDVNNETNEETEPSEMSSAGADV